MKTAKEILLKHLNKGLSKDYVLRKINKVVDHDRYIAGNVAAKNSSRPQN